MGDVHEAWADDRVLLTFDGSVLELFGFNDPSRIHIAHRPELQFEDGRRPHLRITTALGNYIRFEYDPARRDSLDALAERLRSAHRPE